MERVRAARARRHGLNDAGPNAMFYVAALLTHMDSFGGDNAAYHRDSNRTECNDEHSVQPPTCNTDDGACSRHSAPLYGDAISYFLPYLWMTRDP